MSNASFGCLNPVKKSGLLAVNVIVSFLWKTRTLIETRSAKIQFSAISSFSTTNNHFKLKFLVRGDLSTIRMYHLCYTQEFWNLFRDETFVFLEESTVHQNSEEGRLAYSYPKKPCIATDRFAWR